MITIGYVEPGHEDQFSGVYDDYVLLPFGKLNIINTLEEAKDFIKQENAKVKPEWPFNSRTIYVFENEIVIGNVRPKKN